jgi:hypothetical protein
VVSLVTREQILDYQTYGDQRAEIRSRILGIKAARRIHVGPVLTFLFENLDTIRYQIQEMIWAERIIREDAIRHEIDTYNELLGAPGGLGATLLVEVDDPAERAIRLSEWRDLPSYLYLRFEDGARVYATHDARQVDEDRLSSVQFLSFPCAGRAPVALGTDFPPLAAETVLTPEQRQALAHDIAG